MKEKIVIINGLRSPIAKSNGLLKDVSADNMAAIISKELVLRSGISYDKFDEVIIGNVSQDAACANVARVISMKAGFSQYIPAYTVHRNCASGMQAISSAIEKIHSGQGKLYLVGGVESMSSIPLLYSNKFKEFMTSLTYAKSTMQKLKIISSFKPSYLKPIIALISGLTDPISGKIMGITAENLANEFKISREEQDEYSLLSHIKAQKAQEDNVLGDEVHPIITKETTFYKDDGIRYGQNIKALNKLRPIFDRTCGSVTAGNSSQVSDGACMLIVSTESYAKELGCEILGYVKDYAYAGLDASRMGLGPIYATKKLFDKTKTKLEDIDLIEMNEAFSAQAIANIKAFKSNKFCKIAFGTEALGEINEKILNINGGAIALGHPVGMSGARIVLTALKQLKKNNKKRALATLCVGGGQGASFLLEV